MDCRAPSRRSATVCTARWAVSRQRRGTSLIEVVMAVFFMAIAMLIFAALSPMAARTSRMSGNYSQAISLAQHKVDQLRSVGYGRLSYRELRAARIIDSYPTGLPFRFGHADSVAQHLPNPIATLDFLDAGPGLTEAIVRIQWTGATGKSSQGDYSLKVIIAND